MGTSNKRVLSMNALCSPESVISELPVNTSGSEKIIKWRSDIEDILYGHDDRLIIVVGPCSIHDPVAALEYARILKPLSDIYSKELLLVMRTYFEKPRTTIGWKGLINDPDLNGTFDINKGLKMARQLLLDINEIGLPVGTEFLDTISPQYISDLVSWGAIGARTTESQVHRELASGLSCPIGFKNGTTGNIQVAVDAIQSASKSHSFLGINESGSASIVMTKGNPFCHVILRGGTVPNYHEDDLELTHDLLIRAGLCTNIMVDCSHANSLKQYKNQIIIAKSVADQVSEGLHDIIGLMIESNLVEGSQKLDPGVTDVNSLVYGQSVTDSCVDIQETVKMLSFLAESVKNRRNV